MTLVHTNVCHCGCDLIVAGPECPRACFLLLMTAMHSFFVLGSLCCFSQVFALQTARESEEIVHPRGISESVMVITCKYHYPAHKPPPLFCQMLACTKWGRNCGITWTIFMPSHSHSCDIKSRKRCFYHFCVLHTLYIIYSYIYIYNILTYIYIYNILLPGLKIENLYIMTVHYSWCV